jgi:hypothetical protein
MGNREALGTVVGKSSHHHSTRLKRADPKAIRRKITVVGERLVHKLNGRSCRLLEQLRQVPSLGRSTL